MGEPVVFRHATPTSAAAAALLAAAEAHLAELYGPSAPLARELLRPPDGGYLVGWEEGVPVAGGGFTRHTEGTAEIRRMFVVPHARSRGIARQLLGAVEDAVRAAGYVRAYLDTGDKQPHAEALYRSAGYDEIGKYRTTSRASYWGAKIL